MANKKPTTGKTAAKIFTSKQLRKLWSELKPQPFIERLRFHQPEQKWALSGTEIVGCCPFHGETSPSFRIYLNRGYAKCFGGGCGVIAWNPVTLWAAIRKISLAEALNELRTQLQVKLLSSSSTSAFTEWDRNQKLKHDIATICHDELLSAIAEPENQDYAYASNTVRYLLQTRMIPMESIPVLPMIGVMPPIARVMNKLDEMAAKENSKREKAALKEGTKAEKYVSLALLGQTYLQQASAHWMGSLVFRMDIAPDSIGRLKLRRPDSRDFMIIADEYEEDIGFFGLGWNLYKNLTGPNHKFAPGAYVVEGEFDALSLMAQQVMKTGGPGYVAIAGGGRYAAAMLDDLSGNGFEEVYLFTDAPYNKGEELIKAWLPEIKHLRARVFTGWDKLPGAGDPDEAVLKFGIDKISSMLLDLNNEELFTNPPEWTFNMAQTEIDQIPDSDLRHRVEVAAGWGRLLKNSIDCDTYVDYCVKHYALPAAMLKREITSLTEDEPGFVLRVVNELSSIFQVIAVKAGDNGRRIYLWHKSDKRMIQIELVDDVSSERELGTVLGTAYQFFIEKMGLPPFLEVPDSVKEKGTWLQDLSKKLKWYYQQALIIMSQGAPDFDLSTHKGQGIHVEKDPLSAFPHIYVVNGRDVYYGTFDSNRKLNWEMLDGPTHRGNIFDVGIRHEEVRWMPWVTKAGDLSAAASLDIVPIYNSLRHILDIGWTFKNHKITVDFMTAHLLATTVCNTFRRQVFMSFHADTSAGKSRLLMGLIGGNDFPRIHLIASAIGMPVYTPAGIQQAMDNKTRPLCLDEFEDEGKDDKKGRTIQEVFEKFRNLVGENNTITMGSRGGEPVKYKLQFPIFTAGINKHRKVQDANRVIPIYLEKIVGREDPVRVILREVGALEVERLKHKLSVALLPRVLDLYETYEQMEQEFSMPGKKPPRVDTRFFESLFPAIAVMKTLGLDYQTFVNDFCEANKETLAVGAEHADSVDIFNWICQSSQLEIMDGDQRKKMNVLKLLATKTTRELVNESGAGLYFDEQDQLLIVNWVDAIQHVLSRHPRWGRETNVHNIREMANRVPNALKPGELEASGALGRLHKYGLLGINATQLTAYSMTATLQSLNPALAAMSDPENNKKVVPIKQDAEKPVVKEKKSDDGDFGS